MANEIFKKESKPKYHIPMMSDIVKIPYNGYYCISTFSGCGGSSLGYRMAGFKVIWANEFVKAALETYKTNFPDTTIDDRDIRIIQPNEILSSINMDIGQLDLLDGSPPCASFSMVGKREKDWGKIKKYSDTKQRTDDLFYEFIRILNGIQPKVFIAENVSGLVKGMAKGYFIDIIKKMKSCGYSVEVKLLDAKWLGVPQSRQRIIFQGIRKDLNIKQKYPSPLKYRYTVNDALPEIKFINDNSQTAFKKPKIINADHKSFNTIVTYGKECIYEAIEDTRVVWSKGNFVDKVSPTIMAQGQGQMRIVEKRNKGNWRSFTISELKRICSFPEDFILTGTYAQQWERLGRAVPPIMMYHIAKTIKEEVLCKI